MMYYFSRRIIYLFISSCCLFLICLIFCSTRKYIHALNRRIQLLFCFVFRKNRYSLVVNSLPLFPSLLPSSLPSSVFLSLSPSQWSSSLDRLFCLAKRRGWLRSVLVIVNLLFVSESVDRKSAIATARSNPFVWRQIILWERSKETTGTLF